MFAEINSKLQSVIKIGFSTVPVVFDNREVAKSASFVRFSIQPLLDTGTSIGSSTVKLAKVAGKCTAQVFVPKGTAAYDSYKYADSIAALFRNKSWVSNSVKIWITTVDVQPVGEVENYYQLNVNIGVRSEAVKTV